MLIATAALLDNVKAKRTIYSPHFPSSGFHVSKTSTFFSSQLTDAWCHSLAYLPTPFPKKLRYIINTRIQLCGPSRQRTPFLSPSYHLPNHPLDLSKSGSFCAHQRLTLPWRRITTQKPISVLLQDWLLLVPEKLLTGFAVDNVRLCSQSWS